MEKNNTKISLYPVFTKKAAIKHFVKMVINSKFLDDPYYIFLTCNDVDHKTCYVIVLDSNAIGIVATTTKDDCLYIDRIGLDVKYQGKGYGRIVLENIVKIAKTCEMKKLMLEVDEENNNAIKLYLKFGFKLCNTDKKHSYYMSYDL
jgi:ribosomal protein S18 acetylase RimI-like enzyme